MRDREQSPEEPPQRPGQRSWVSRAPNPMSKHEAQDVYQDAFLKAYRNIGNFRFECSFYTWIYRIVTNLCLDQLRKKQVRKEESPVATTESGEAFDLLEQVADVRSGANPERD